MHRRPSHQTLGSSGRRGSPAVPWLALSLALGFIVASLAWAPVAMAQSDFPLTVVDDEGTEVVIEAEPQRIISLSPANTEIVFGLGAGDRLVGGTDFDDHPAEAAALPDVATFSGVIMEQVVALDPDLVLAAGNSFTPPDDIARMRELGYPVVVLYASDVEAVLADIELIGDAIGAPEQAAAMTGQMSQQLDASAEAAAESGRVPRTFYQLGSEPEIYGPAPDSFVADMVALAGGDPITTSDPAVFAIPLEELILADPEVIIVGDANYGICPADVLDRAGWAGMTAVVDGAVRAVDDIPVTRPGPRLPQGLASLAMAIDAELDLDLAGLGLAPDPPICSAD